METAGRSSDMREIPENLKAEAEEKREEMLDAISLFSR